MRYLRCPYDQDWLDYQHEIGLRDTHLKKNKTDEAQTPSQIPLRYIIAFTAVINDTIKPFLASKGMGEWEQDASRSLPRRRGWCWSKGETIAGRPGYNDTTYEVWGTMGLDESKSEAQDRWTLGGPSDRGEPLSPCVKFVLSKFFPRGVNLNDIRIHFGFLKL